eukprot:Clim_evm10s198 gene=Clim_evmTU10s198
MSGYPGGDDATTPQRQVNQHRSIFGGDTPIGQRQVPPPAPQQQPIELQQQQIPPQQHQIRPQQQHMPPHQQQLPGQQQSVPLQHQHMPPVQQHMPPVQQHMPPAQQHMPPAQQHIPPVQQHMPPVQQHMPPATSGQSMYNISNVSGSGAATMAQQQARSTTNVYAAGVGVPSGHMSSTMQPQQQAQQPQQQAQQPQQQAQQPQEDFSRDVPREDDGKPAPPDGTKESPAKPKEPRHPDSDLPAPPSFFTGAQYERLGAQLEAYTRLSANRALSDEVFQRMAANGGAEGQEGEDNKEKKSWTRYVKALRASDVKSIPYSQRKQLYRHLKRQAPQTIQNSPQLLRIYRSLLQIQKDQKPMIAGAELFDPLAMYRAREHRTQQRINDQLRELRNMPVGADRRAQRRRQIQERALELRSLQTQVRQKLLGTLTRDTQIEAALDLKAYHKAQREAVSAAQEIARQEARQRAEKERIKRAQSQKNLNNILSRQREILNAARERKARAQRTAREIVHHLQRIEREKKRAEERMEKERMRRLMMEDEEGYRKLVDERKDKRLAHLLDQTDDFIRNLTSMLKEQKRSIAEIGAAQDARQRERALTEEAADQTATDDPEAYKKEQEKKSLEDAKAKIQEAYIVDDDEGSNPTADAAYYLEAHTVKEEVKEQPSMLEFGKLKHYQVQGLEWLVSLYNNKLNGILADEMGLGKTIQSISLLCHLIEHKKMMGPYLITVPLSTLSNWSLEFQRWAPRIQVIAYKGSPPARKLLQQELRQGRFNVCLTTYEYIIKDRGVLARIDWKYLIVDEGHRMKNHNAKLSVTINEHYKVPNRILLTGTPLQNNLTELWSLLNFILPKIFSSSATFDQWFNAPFANTGEKMSLNEEESMLVIRRLHKILRPFLLRRLKKDVEAQLPDKQEYVIKCGMSALQKTLYNHMKARGVMLTQGDNRGARSLQNIIMQLRKICNHPFLYSEIESAVNEMHHGHGGTVNSMLLYRASGKFELLDRVLAKLKACGHRVLIFSQFVDTIEIMADYMRWRGYKHMQLDGSTKAEDRQILLKHFNAPDSDSFCFLLSTRAGGLGLNLQTADTVIIFDSDWNPHQDLQAQDRAHRIGQKNEVRVLRFVTTNSVEEKILAAARYKMNMDAKVIQAGKFDQKSTAADRKAMLLSLLRDDEDLEEEEDDIPDAEALNRMLARGDEEFEQYSILDQEFAKEFATDWKEADLKGKPHRLMMDSEVPDYLKKTDDEVERLVDDDAEVENYGRGRRERAKVVYDDNMTERQFMRAVESGKFDSIAQKRAEKLLTKRKRGQAEGDTEGASEGAAATDEQDTAREQMYLGIKKVFDTVYHTYDSDGQLVTELFRKAPSRKDYPDYYEIIKEVIDLNTIKKKIKKAEYNSWEELDADMDLLVKNAQTYNLEGSEVYDDSKMIADAYDKAKAQAKADISAGLLKPPVPQSESASTKSNRSNKSTRSNRSAKRAAAAAAAESSPPAEDTANGDLETPVEEAPRKRRSARRS